MVNGEGIYFQEVCNPLLYLKRSRGAVDVVPVVDKMGQPLMPTTSANARRWVKYRIATYFYRKGVFCVRLNRDPYANYKQRIVCGVDPGSRWEAMTFKSNAQTFLNVQNDATGHVKNALQTRREMRRGRRFRKTPCRKNKYNRSTCRGWLAPSSRARWETKLRLIHIWRKIFPISDYIVEDIAAPSKPGQRHWNMSFSPLEAGKNWFYGQIKNLGSLTIKAGWETKNLRDTLGLAKSKNNQRAFNAHCVDSWVLANSVIGGHNKPDNIKILYLHPLRFRRRQLHKLQPAKDGLRCREGGTRSLGFKKGSLVKHIKYNICYVGGNTKGRLSLHSLETGIRVTRTAKIQDCIFLGYNSWRWTYRMEEDD